MPQPVRAGRSELLEFEGGFLVVGQQDLTTVALGDILVQAEVMNLTQLTMFSAGYHWEAHRQDSGRWHVTRTVL